MSPNPTRFSGLKIRLSMWVIVFGVLQSNARADDPGPINFVSASAYA